MCLFLVCLECFVRFLILWILLINLIFKLVGELNEFISFIWSWENLLDVYIGNVVVLFLNFLSEFCILFSIYFFELLIFRNIVLSLFLIVCLYWIIIGEKLFFLLIIFSSSCLDIKYWKLRGNNFVLLKWLLINVLYLCIFSLFVKLFIVCFNL